MLGQVVYGTAHLFDSAERKSSGTAGTAAGCSWGRYFAVQLEDLTAGLGMLRGTGYRGAAELDRLAFGRFRCYATAGFR